MSELDDTLDEIPESAVEAFAVSLGRRVHVQFGALSHLGNVRVNNEDQFIVMRRSRTREVLRTSLADGTLPEVNDEIFVMIVADGMGGASFGEVASELALRIAWELGTDDDTWPEKIDNGQVRQLLDESDARVQQIHRRLLDETREQPELTGMGTTLTAAYSIGRDAFVVHVGDSRAYLIRDGQIRQITRDHTLAQHLVDAGVEASQTVAFQHVLTNCLGGNAERVVSEGHHLQLHDGDYLLLCTDGLSDLVIADELLQAVNAATEPQDGCQTLVNLALERGGKDNVTVVLARYAMPKEEDTVAEPDDTPADP